jgi:hypothetical protein
MATAENLTVAVERAIHDAITEMVQRISDQHGIQIRVFRADWDEVSNSGEATKFRVRAVSAETFSKP